MRRSSSSASDSGTPATSFTSQWAEWEFSRRTLFRTSFAGLAAAAVANGGLLPRAVAAQDDEGTPVMGGSLSMSLADDDVQSFDPIVPTDNMSIWTMLLVYDQLIRVAPDGKSLEPGLAESWEISDDLLTYTLHLRDATFHDGSPVTAEDVVYSVSRTAFDEASTWKGMVEVIDTIEASDDKTVVITLNTVWSPFEADLALFACSIIPKTAHESQGADLFNNPIGSGPFMLDSWDKGSQMVLKKNPDYWDEGKPYLDELVFTVLIDANSRMLQFQGGELDIATSVPYSQIESLKSNPDVVVLQDSVARFDYIGMNVTREPWSDKNLRQAINYAVNNQQIIDNVLFGSAVFANTYLPLMAGHSETVTGYPFDLDKAKELLAQSAYADGWKGELLISSGDPVADQISQIVAAQMKEINGDITVIAQEPAANRDAVRVKGEYDWQKGYYTTDIIDPDQLTTFAVKSDGGTQAIFTHYVNEEVDALCEQAATEPDWETRLGLYEQIQQMHTDDAPMIFLFYPTGGVATVSSVKNFKVLPTGNYRLWETWKEQ